MAPERRSTTFLTLVSAACAPLIVPGTPSQARAAPLRAQADTFADAGARTLVARARRARAVNLEGLERYEATLRERIYVGLAAARFRRERGLFEEERIARVLWRADGERAVQWMGARRAIPIIGADTRRRATRAAGRWEGPGSEAEEALRNDLPDELLGEVDLPGFALDPGAERMVFGDSWALHPLADTALAHYRYASGDTLRIALPDRVITLIELRVRPRRADFHLVAGSLWFDAGTADLVRATYRPARPFNLSIDEPEDAGDVPGFLKPVEAELAYVTVEYSLQELRYWLPRRFALEGEVRLGRFVRIPLTVEWSLGDYRVNDSDVSIPVTGPLPPGWARKEVRRENDEGEAIFTTVLVPRKDSLLISPLLTRAPAGKRSPTAFSDREIDALTTRLQALLPTYRRFEPRLSWGLRDGLLRYNRIEGLSVGGAAELPLAPDARVRGEGRAALAETHIYGALSLALGRERRGWEARGFHELRGMGDWWNPFSFTNSVGNLLLGLDKGQYYRATGASLAFTRTGQRTRVRLEAFHERHTAVGEGTDFYLFFPVRNADPPPLLSAGEGRYSGGRISLNWFSGIDPNGLILTGQILAEGGGGDAEYARGAVVMSAAHPIFWGLSGAVEVGAGSTLGSPPVQKEFFLGSSRTLRGYDANSLHGTSFWRARGEVGGGFAGARLTAFTDWGWAGPREAFGFRDARMSVGLGASLLDGLLRADLARGLRRSGEWKIHLYLDGIL